jgi:hypothetical protein
MSLLIQVISEPDLKVFSNAIKVYPETFLCLKTFQKVIKTVIVFKVSRIKLVFISLLEDQNKE